MQAQLIATDIACRRGDRLLFSGLSLNCASGDAVHVTGANGIGKSSLMRILAGLARPFAGEISCTGAVGLVDERLALDMNKPLGKALAFWTRLTGASADEEMLGLLQLEPLMDIPVRYLSTGQKKRAALARLRSTNCPIWLLDEPLNGLDTQAQQTFEMLISAHCANGGIAVVASHQPIALAGSTLAIESFAR